MGLACGCGRVRARARARARVRVYMRTRTVTVDGPLQVMKNKTLGERRAPEMVRRGPKGGALLALLAGRSYTPPCLRRQSRALKFQRNSHAFAFTRRVCANTHPHALRVSPRPSQRCSVITLPIRASETMKEVPIFVAICTLTAASFEKAMCCEVGPHGPALKSRGDFRRGRP